MFIATKWFDIQGIEANEEVTVIVKTGELAINTDQIDKFEKELTRLIEEYCEVDE